MAQRNLAQYFEHTEDAKRTKDKWLSDYFYNRCLETGSMVSTIKNSKCLKIIFVATLGAG